MPPMAAMKPSHTALAEHLGGPVRSAPMARKMLIVRNRRGVALPALSSTHWITIPVSACCCRQSKHRLQADTTAPAVKVGRRLGLQRRACVRWWVLSKVPGRGRPARPAPWGGGSSGGPSAARSCRWQCARGCARADHRRMRLRPLLGMACVAAAAVHSSRRLAVQGRAERWHRSVRAGSRLHPLGVPDQVAWLFHPSLGEPPPEAWRSAAYIDITTQTAEGYGLARRRARLSRQGLAICL